MKGWNPPSASLLMTQSWEDWLTHLKAMLPFIKAWTGWIVGQRETWRGFPADPFLNSWSWIQWSLWVPSNLGYSAILCLLSPTLGLDGKRLFTLKIRESRAIWKCTTLCTCCLAISKTVKKIRYVGISRMFSFARKKFIAVEKHSFQVMTTEPTNQTNKSPKKSN